MDARSQPVLTRLYTTLSPVYAPLTRPLSARARRVGLRWLDVRDGDRVVEVGTGPGRAFCTLLSQNPTGWTVGVDPTEAMRKRTRRQATEQGHNQFRVRAGRATSLPCPDNHFDALFSAYVHDLLPAQQLGPAVTELRRVLRPGGRGVLITMASGTALAGRAWTTLARTLPLLLGGSRPISLRPHLRDEGFTIQRTTVVTQMGLPSAVTEVSLHSPSSN